MPKPLTDKDLLAIIAQHEKSALGSNMAAGPTVAGTVLPAGQQMTTLEVDRYNALNAYMGRPYGNEQEGRSQIVIPELRDTIEWIKPQLIRMFVGGKAACRFEAVNGEDEDQAELESEVVNYVFMHQNDGFFVLHDFFTDALMLRNGYARVYTEKSTKSDVESYTGLTDIELAKLLKETEDEIEVLEQRETQSPLGPVFDIKLRRTHKVHKVKVECIPPEETLVSPKARHSVEDCGFVEHKTTVTRSELVEMGFEQKLVYSIAVSKPSWLDLVSIARDEVVDQLSEDTDTGDPSTREVDFRVVELRVDYDGDGIAELRRVILGGEQILDNDEIPETGIVSCSPIRMPHRHIGISYYDLLSDLQAIKTTLFRQGLDNLYLANNSRVAVNHQNVNLSDLLVSRPGGIVRVTGSPMENIMPFPTAQGVLAQVIPALEYVDTLREMRTGIGKDTMGVDADALQDVTKGGQLAAMSAAAMKVELVARLLAEGVKDIFRKIHSELRRNQDKPMTVRLAGKWVDVNPSEWGPRESLTVNVGLGSGIQSEARANVILLGQMQEKLAPLGLIGPKQAFATFKRGAEILGVDNPQEFAMDPDSPEYAKWMAQHPPQPNPAVQVAQIRAQSVSEQAQSKQQTEILNLKGQLAKAQAEVSHAAIQGERDRQIDAAGLDNDMAQTLIKVIGQIVASQLKQVPNADGGRMVASDFREAEQGIV